MAKDKENDVLSKDGQGDSGETDWSNVPFWTSQRFITAMCTFWGFACLYLERVNLSIAMVCMIKSEVLPNETLLSNGFMVNGSTVFLDPLPSQKCKETLESNYLLDGYSIANDSSGSLSVVDSITTTMKTLVAGDEGYCDSLGLKASVDTTGEFTWSKELQGLLLASFFWGYLVLQVPGGVMSERYGPKRVVFYTMLPVAILNLLSPVAARASPWVFLVTRVLIGIGQSALYPAAQALFARWSPPSERSRLVGVSLSGGQFGNALIFPIGGLLCSSLGWDSVFYVMGAIGFVWCIIWYIVVYDSPSLSRRISPLERGYIQHHVAFRDAQKKPSTPWKSIFTSLPFWSIMVAHACGNYGLYMLLTQIPTYMKEVLKFDLKSNGVFSMMPYLSMWICITVAGIIADKLITGKVMSRLWVRKLMSSIGLFCPALCLIGVTFMDCTQQIGAVVLLCGTVGMSGFGFAGYLVNHGDIAPQFAGTLFGITNVAATIPGIIAPYLVGAITTNKTREEWQIAFFICAAVYIFGGIFYVIFASTDLVKWAALPAPMNGHELEVPESRKMIVKEPADDDNKV